MNWNCGAFPSFLRRGGCDPRKFRAATLAGAAGVVVSRETNHPSGASEDRPPLLAKEGECSTIPIHSSPLTARNRDSLEKISDLPSAVIINHYKPPPKVPPANFLFDWSGH